MKKQYTHYTIIGINQMFLGLLLLFPAHMSVDRNGAAFWITLVFGAGFTVSGIMFIINGIRKNKQFSKPKEEKDIWE